MLERLTIRDLALVEGAEMEFGRGLTAVTGETGAGKSLTVEALALVVGGRADADIVREGAKACVVEAEFRLAGESGSRSSVTLANLKRLGELLLDLHGQHEHQSLLREGAALATLDRLAGLEPERAKFAETLAALREAEHELARLRDSLATFAERREYLTAAAAELDEARLREGEEAELQAEAARLAHADRLRELASLALERLSDGEHAAVVSAGAARHAIEQAAALDPSLADALAELDQTVIAAQESARTLGGYLGRLEADPERLETVEARRDLYARLTRKYRRSLPELIAWRSELAVELAEGEDGDAALARVESRVANAEAACLAVGKALSRKRAVAARVGLRFTANPGEPARALAKIASGGELSRVMLALKCALQTRDRVDLLVFDEVDSGIGGAVAQAVGERLRRLGEHHQVVCVTHLPLIAALAGHHLAVTKHVASGRTVARVTALERADRVEELARMLAGERVTETTRRQARELLAAPATGA